MSQAAYPAVVDQGQAGASAWPVSIPGTITAIISGAVEVMNDAGNPLPVSGTVSAAQSGTWNVGTVATVSALTSITNVVHVDDNGATLSVDDGGGSLTVDGTVSISGTPNVSVTSLPGTSLAGGTLNQLDYDTGAGTVNMPMVGLALPASGGPVAGGTSSNPLRVDTTGTTTQPVNDAGGSLTVDGTVAATQSGTWSVRAQDGSGNALTSAARGSERALSVQIVDASGAQLVSFGTQYTEDVASSGAELLMLAGAVRRDTAASSSGTDGDYSTINTDATGRLWVNTELPDAAALADGASNPTTPTVGDCVSLFNGATWDRMRGTLEGTALASGTRTSDTTSGDLTNYNGRGVTVGLNITAAGGAGSLTIVLQEKDPISGTYSNLHATPATTATTGTTKFELGPGINVTSISSPYFLRLAAQLPRTFRVYVVHSGGSNWTYSVSYTIHM